MTLINDSQKETIGEYIVHDLADFVSQMGSGSHKTREYIRFMRPSDELFLGCLFPLSETEEEYEENEELTLEETTDKSEKDGKELTNLLSTLRRPSAISVSFGAKPTGSIFVTPKLSVYYRVIPIDEDYKKFMERNNREDWTKEWNVQEYINSLDSGTYIEHPAIWKKVIIELPTQELVLNDLSKWKREYSLKDFKNADQPDDLIMEPDSELNIDLFKKDGKGSKMGFWALQKRKPYIKENSISWNVTLTLDDRGPIPGFPKEENVHLFTVSQINSTIKSKDAKWREFFEPVIFNCSLKIELNDVNIFEIPQSWSYELPYSKDVTGGNPPPPFEIDYPIKVWGNACIPEYNGDTNEIITYITTIKGLTRDRPWDQQNIPLKNDNTKFDGSFNEALQFKKLAEDPHESINKILEMLEEYRQSYQVWDKPEKSVLDKQQFNLIIERFTEGQNLIFNDKQACRAFQLMNETYMNNYGKKAGWRLFQIVFIIGNLKRALFPKDSSGEYEDVELLFVATGGGKTESYVGLTLSVLFYQRIIGIKFGIATWVKFPLRLLALDQFDRLSKTIIWAERIRIDEKLGGSPFSLGFFVGNDENFPSTVAEWVVNRMYTPKDPTTGWQPKEFSRCNGDGFDQGGLLSECPICQQKENYHQITEKGRIVNIAGDYRWQYIPEQHRVKHWCNDCDTEFHLYITDEEIYRYLPSTLVSTVDKLATGAWRPHMAGLLGAPLYFCEEHGFSVTPRTCSIMDIRCGNVSSDSFEGWHGRGRPFDKNNTFRFWSCAKNPIHEDNNNTHGPVLIVQDELHLIKENLGTISSYFESLADTIIEKNTKRHPKYIAMSATIAGARKQVGLLYLRSSTLWPGDAPSSGPLVRPEKDVFFQHSDKIHRVFVGLMPHGKSPDFTAYRALQFCWMRVHQYFNDLSLLKDRFPKNFTIDDDEDLKKYIKDFYLKSFVYQGRKIGTHNFASSLDRIVNKDLLRDDYKEIILDSVTGDNTMEEIREHRRRMAKEGDLDVLISTSLISHGVDISNVNQMFFQGMPDSTAEFIQASSRIGRKFPGIIFVSFYPSRTRDLEMSSSFSQYLATLKFWVEPVPIARWCEQAFREIFSTSVCFTLSCYGQRLLGSENKIGGSWPITIHQLGYDKGGTFPGFLKWRIKVPSLDSELKELLREGLGISPSSFITQQVPKDLLPETVINELDQQFEELYNNFTTILTSRTNQHTPDRYKKGQLAYYLATVLGARKKEDGTINGEYVADWLNCMTGLRGIQEPVNIKPRGNSGTYHYLSGGK